MRPEALIFDVDGTLAETEELHRAAFNASFASERLDWTWDVALYRDLLRVTGGKERMRHFADTLGLTRADLTDTALTSLHLEKNRRFGDMMRSGTCVLRPGVETLIRSAPQLGLRLAIATTTSRANVEALLAATLGGDGLARFEVIVAGDEVAHKKPAPDVYLRVLDILGLPASACLAFEDSRNGLRAALTAGLAVIVTPGIYTAHETFEGAAQVLPDLAGFAAGLPNYLQKRPDLRICKAAMPK